MRALVLIPPLLAANAAASSSEDCRSGSHTNSQSHRQPRQFFTIVQTCA